MTLADLIQGQRCVVEKVQAPEPLSRRLLDLGFVPGTTVLAQHVNGKGLSAYYLRGSVFALRQDTAAQIVVKPKGDLS